MVMVMVMVMVIPVPGDAPQVEQAAIPLRQRGRRHAHIVRCADHRGLACVSSIDAD